MVAGWVKRKVKNSDKWVRRWLEISKYVLYSYQACPAEVPQARVMNTLDLRKTKEIKLQPDESMPGLFVIVPETSDDSHPGYVMRAENDAMAQVWVQGLRKAREDELAALAVTRNPPVPPIPVATIIQDDAYIDAPIADAPDASAYEIMAPALSDDASTLPPPPSTVPTADTLGDTKSTFTQLKEKLELDDAVREIPVDVDFMDAFQVLFDLSFADIGHDAENTCRNLVDVRGRGSIRFIQWEVFYRTWTRSGLSMPEYLQSKNT